MPFFDLKSMSIVGRSDISFYLCKLVCRLLLTFTVFCTNVYLLMLSTLSI